MPTEVILRLQDYKTLVFDCDGVILNSNKIKTRAFYAAALPYGENAARALVDYHVANGGISRYKKFDYFLKQIVDEPGPDSNELDTLLETYANVAWKELQTCDVADGLSDLKKKTAGSCWMIVSGGDQGELRRLFNARNLSRFFDGGIFGSPDSKKLILQRELQRGNIGAPAVFFGDTLYDYQAATEAGLDFIFVSGWSEVTDWNNFIWQKKITAIHSIDQLL